MWRYFKDGSSEEARHRIPPADKDELMFAQFWDGKIFKAQARTVKDWESLGSRWHPFQPGSGRHWAGPQQGTYLPVWAMAQNAGDNE